MSNYKVKVNNEAESKEVQGLFEQLGLLNKDWSNIDFPKLISNHVGGEYSDYPMNDWIVSRYKELTIQQLKDLVVLKRNDVGDATHECKQDPEFKYRLIDNWWHCITPENKEWRKDSITPEEAPLFIKPISPLKEYLVPQGNGKYALTKATEKRVNDWVEVAEGADFYIKSKDPGNYFFFKKDGLNEYEFHNGSWILRGKPLSKEYFNNGSVIWQRHTQPEALPFVDDEPKPLNNTYAEIEQLRKVMMENPNQLIGRAMQDHDSLEAVNNPQHYNKGGIECIDAIEASMTPEAFKGYLKGNVQKYMWRYEHKGGKESLQKAQWYLNKLILKL